MTDDHEKFSGPAHKGADRSAPYPVSRLAPAIELVDLAKQIGKADQMLNVSANSKLKVIVEQIRALQEEARTVLEDTRRDQELHRAQCNFKRIPGRTYHLYAKPDGARYFSMLSPDDWRGSPPHEYLGAYRLENDMSWTPADRDQPGDDLDNVVERLLTQELLPPQD